MAHNLVSNCLYIQDSNEGLTLDKLLLKENYGYHIKLLVLLFQNR